MRYRSPCGFGAVVADRSCGLSQRRQSRRNNPLHADRRLHTSRLSKWPCNCATLAGHRHLQSKLCGQQRGEPDMVVRLANFKVNPPSSTQSNSAAPDLSRFSPSERTAQQLRRYRCRNRETRRLRRRPNELYTALSRPALRRLRARSGKRGTQVKRRTRSCRIAIRSRMTSSLTDWPSRGPLARVAE